MEYGGVVFMCANQLLLFQVSSGHMEVQWPKAIALQFLVGHQNVVDLVAFVIFMRAPPTCFYLESSGRAAYMETHPNQCVCKSQFQSKATIGVSNHDEYQPFLYRGNPTGPLSKRKASMEPLHVFIQGGSFGMGSI